MTCTACSRNLILCICPDEVWESRMQNLESSPFLAFDFDAIRAQRLLSRFDIERDRQQVKSKNLENT